jgi:hypothetical protein
VRSRKRSDIRELPHIILFSAQEIWDGNGYCEGIIRDWASWQREGSASYDQLMQVLHVLSPSLSEPLVAGELRKVSLNDPKRYPTLKMPYDVEVPIIHASAGMRRIIAMAYLLVWAWQEHRAACELTRQEPAKEVIFLFDEVEAHLHRQWQRRIIPALLDVMKAVAGDRQTEVQVIATTHSPLILASTEPLFDPAVDSWFDLDLIGEDRKVILEKKPFVRRGDYSNWLTSEAFDLKEARSVQTEEAITQALALLRTPSPSHGDIERVDGLLRNSLSEIDSFWLRWSDFRDRMAEGAQ